MPNYACVTVSNLRKGDREFVSRSYQCNQKWSKTFDTIALYIGLDLFYLNTVFRFIWYQKRQTDLVHACLTHGSVRWKQKVWQVITLQCFEWQQAGYGLLCLAKQDCGNLRNNLALLLPLMVKSANCAIPHSSGINLDPGIQEWRITPWVVY